MYKYKILLVDDEPDISELCTLQIKKSIPDAEVICATNATDGYRKAREVAYDVIWTDYRMPRILGTDFALALRETHPNYNVPIIIFSGYIDDAKKNCSIKDNIYFLSKYSGVENAVAVLIDILQQQTKLKKEKAEITSDKKFIPLNSPLAKNFILSTIHIIQLMCNLNNVKQTNVSITKNHQILNADVVSVVNMSTDDFSGYFLLAFSKKVFLSAAEQFVGRKFSSIDNENSVVAGELSKIIFSHTISQIDGNGEIDNLQRENPHLIIGKKISITGHKSNMAIITFSSEIGDFLIGINPIES
ncbi:MAG: response regulator [Oligoflexia bacterium]|nr:response regulator [Oligoflexia bacterium]